MTDTLEELDPTKSDKYALAAEMRYVAVTLRNMRGALASETLWARRADATLMETEGLLMERALVLDGRNAGS